MNRRHLRRWSRPSSWLCLREITFFFFLNDPPPPEFSPFPLPPPLPFLLLYNWGGAAPVGATSPPLTVVFVMLNSWPLSVILPPVLVTDVLISANGPEVASIVPVLVVP